MTDLAQVVDGTTTNLREIAGRKKLVAEGTGGSAWNIRAVSGDQTAAAGDLLLVDCSSAASVVTLPDSPASGSRVRVKMANPYTTHSITVQRSGSNTIDGAVSHVLSTDYEWVELIYHGSVWYQVG